jgi:peroxiredoxin
MVKNPVLTDSPLADSGGNNGMRFAGTIVFFLGIGMFASAQLPGSNDGARPASSIGREVRSKIPAFELRDQKGQKQSNETLKGTNGTILLFFRSADWWPFCKAQLVELQAARERFEKQGIKLAAISYDSEAILKEFADRHKIDYPLLADPDSATIRKFKVLNREAAGFQKGMAHAGFFYIDAQGIIREKFFESNDLDRFTPNDVIVKLFPELAEQVNDKVVEAPHLQLSLAHSDRVVIPGNRVSLIAEIRLPTGVHVYSPEVKGYKPIVLSIHPTTDVVPVGLTYPRSNILYLEAIHEHVPVFEGEFRIVYEITINRSREFLAALGSGKEVAVTGELKYQACDERVCYPPASLPVSWKLQVLPPDRQRSSEAIQHK